jgi:hypothetical protein
VVRAGPVRGWLEAEPATGRVTVEGLSVCRGDYDGEEGRRATVTTEVARAAAEPGGRAEVLFTENGRDCLHLVVSVRGPVAVVQLASACRVEVGLVLSWSAAAGTLSMVGPGEQKVAVRPGSLTLANVFLNPEKPPGWSHRLLGISHVEDRDQDGMEMQTV